MEYGLNTPRLRLRMWRVSDRDAFAAMNGDRRVMRYFPAPLTPEESDAFLARIVDEWRTAGYGLYAVERKCDGMLLGYTGLHRATFTAAFTPCIEIGWRLRPEAWGQGYATEAARAVLDEGFGRLALARIHSFTACCNTPSEAVMRRLGMRCVGTFDHPALPEGHVLRRHVLYVAER